MSLDSVLPAAGYVSDGGLETDLIFNHGVELPEFASFPLVESDGGRSLLPGLRVVGGCCGTDARHVAALWGV